MMEKKTHPQLSQISVVFEKIGDITDIKDMFMTPPLRVMRPFFDGDFTDIMLMTSSPGLLEGDRQVHSYHAKENTRARVLSQSYEKVHPVSENGRTRRSTNIRVDKGGTLICKFLPVIFYKDSRFINRVEIDLEDSSSKLIYVESFVAGRIGRGESFEFRDFSNIIKANLGGELIYFENNYVDPKEIAYDQIGFFEGFDHFSSLIIFNFNEAEKLKEEIQKILESQEKKLGIHAGVSTSFRNDMQVRILANMGQDIVETVDLIVKCAENYI